MSNSALIKKLLSSQGYPSVFNWHMFVLLGRICSMEILLFFLQWQKVFLITSSGACRYTLLVKTCISPCSPGTAHLKHPVQWDIVNIVSFFSTGEISDLKLPNFSCYPWMSSFCTEPWNLANIYLTNSGHCWYIIFVGVLRFTGLGNRLVEGV